MSDPKPALAASGTGAQGPEPIDRRASLPPLATRPGGLPPEFPPPRLRSGKLEGSMPKNLIIVESPAKTRTLKKFLGRDWAVEASVGHIRDLPKKDMGLGPGFEPKYKVLDAKKEVVKKLKEAAKKAERIYLAPDPDREGEAIAWHIAEVLGYDKEMHRVTFNEITKSAVTKALAKLYALGARQAVQTFQPA